jgi:hypothetical protein
MTDRLARSVLFLALSSAFVAGGCRAHRRASGHNDSTEPSPNASILPAPLASGADLFPHVGSVAFDGGRVSATDSGSRLLFGDAGPPPPRPLRADQPLPRDTLTLREESGVTLNAHWVWADVPAPPNVAELDKEGLKRARAKTALAVTIDLALAGRMRMVLDSSVFPLPAGSELRARVDRYGQVLAWPSDRAYRVLPPGSLRALFAERRTDVLPLVSGTAHVTGHGKLLGFDTTRSDVTSAMGHLTLEQAHVGGTGQSGELLCRLLVELIAVDPAAPVCRHEVVPLLAQFHWAEGGQLSFQVDGISHLQDLLLGDIYVPPADADFEPNELPPASGALLSEAELGALRSRVAKMGPPEKTAPEQGLTAVNHTDTLRYLLLDGVPVAWVRPRSSTLVIGTKPGRYLVSWRDFFGTQITPPRLVELPALLEVGAVDAGVH